MTTLEFFDLPAVLITAMVILTVLLWGLYFDRTFKSSLSTKLFEKLSMGVLTLIVWFLLMAMTIDALQGGTGWIQSPCM